VAAGRAASGFLHRVQFRVMFGWKCMKRVLDRAADGSFRLQCDAKNAPVHLMCGKGKQGVIVDWSFLARASYS